MYDILMRDISIQVKYFLTDRCTIQEPSQATDEIGTPIDVYQVVAADVRCRLIRGDKPVLKDLGLQENSRETYRLIVGTDVTLKTGQRVIVRENAYEILGLRQQLTDEVFHEALIGRLE